MDYIMIERTVYDAMVAALKDCRTALQSAVSRLSYKSRDEWIDNNSAQSILCKSQRSLQNMRATGAIGYSLLNGKVFYPANEIGRLLEQGFSSGRI